MICPSFSIIKARPGAWRPYLRRKRAGITNCPLAETFTVGMAISLLCFTVIIIVKHPLKRYNISLKGKIALPAASLVSCFKTDKMINWRQRNAGGLAVIELNHLTKVYHRGEVKAVDDLNLLGMMVDLTYPRLDWVDPQQAMKSNFNSLIAMVLALPLVIILVLSALLLARLGQGYNAMVTLLALELILAGLVTTRFLEGMAGRRFGELEE